MSATLKLTHKTIGAEVRRGTSSIASSRVAAYPGFGDRVRAACSRWYAVHVAGHPRLPRRSRRSRPGFGITRRAGDRAGGAEGE